MRKHKILYISFIILIITSAFLAVSYFVEISKIAPKTEVNLEANQNIFPVLYYEYHSGFWGVGTYTFLLDGNEVIELEDHSRTFSRTVPSSALANLKDPSAKNLGQLMVYYNSPDGEIFLFDNYKTDEFAIIKNDVKVIIPREHYESYHEFLYFDGNYYLFTLLNSIGDILRVYKLSENFETEKTFEINYGTIGIPDYAFIEDSFAVTGSNLFIAAEDRILKYDIETAETEFISPGYNVLGIIADSGRFHSIGTTENGNYIFETFDSEGKSIRKTEKALPFDFKYSPQTINSNSTLYMYGSEIYFRFAYEEKCWILSFDMESEKWTNYWIAKKEKLPYNPGNVKFVIEENGALYDLFPFWNNM